VRPKSPSATNVLRDSVESQWMLSGEARWRRMVSPSMRERPSSLSTWLRQRLAKPQQLTERVISAGKTFARRSCMMDELILSPGTRSSL
jgi:hypothetical protein